MGKKRIILDTNLIISAFGWGGNPRKIVEAVVEGKYELVISQKILDEIRRVMDYPKLKFSEQLKSEISAFIEMVAILVDADEEPDICDDTKDNMVLAPACVTNIDYIVTGDDDLLRLREFRGAKIVNPADFISLENL